MKHVSTPIFQGLFKNIVFISVALVIKKLWAILDFFFYTLDFLPYAWKKKLQKNPFKLQPPIKKFIVEQLYSVSSACRLLETVLTVVSTQPIQHVPPPRIHNLGNNHLALISYCDREEFPPVESQIIIGWILCRTSSCDWCWNCKLSKFLVQLVAARCQPSQLSYFKIKHIWLLVNNLDCNKIVHAQI